MAETTRTWSCPPPSPAPTRCRHGEGETRSAGCPRPRAGRYRPCPGRSWIRPGEGDRQHETRAGVHGSSRRRPVDASRRMRALSCQPPSATKSESGDHAGTVTNSSPVRVHSRRPFVRSRPWPLRRTQVAHRDRETRAVRADDGANRGSTHPTGPSWPSKNRLLADALGHRIPHDDLSVVVRSHERTVSKKDTPFTQSWRLLSHRAISRPLAGSSSTISGFLSATASRSSSGENASSVTQPRPAATGSSDRSSSSRHRPRIDVPEDPARRRIQAEALGCRRRRHDRSAGLGRREARRPLGYRVVHRSDRGAPA